MQLILAIGCAPTTNVILEKSQKKRYIRVVGDKKGFVPILEKFGNLSYNQGRFSKILPI